MKELSYQQAIEELQDILRELQGEQVSIDELEAKSERATELLEYCQQRLRDLNAKLAPKEDKPNP